MLSLSIMLSLIIVKQSLLLDIKYLADNLAKPDKWYVHSILGIMNRCFVADY